MVAYGRVSNPADEGCVAPADSSPTKLSEQDSTCCAGFSFPILQRTFLKKLQRIRDCVDGRVTLNPDTSESHFEQISQTAGIAPDHWASTHAC